MTQGSPTTVYCVVTCDLFHYGHVRFFREARKLGDRLVVGVCSDEDVYSFKAVPIVSLEQRCEVVSACRYVDEVIPAAPPYVSTDFVKSHDIDLVVASEGYREDVLESYYRQPRDTGILRLVPRTPGISSSIIVKRCQDASAKEDTSEHNLKTLFTDYRDRFQKQRALLYEEMYGTGHQSAAAERLALAVGNRLGLIRGDRVLDFGCGTGGTALLFARQWGAAVTGVDISEDNIRICEARGGDAPPGNATFICGNAAAAKQAGSYDALWTKDTLLYVTDKRACLRQLRECLAVGRSSLIADVCRGSGHPSRDFEDHIYSCGYDLATAENYPDMLTGAGFTLVDSCDYTDVYVDSMREDLAGLQARRDTFVQKRRVNEYDHLVQRWESKIDFFVKDLLRAVYFVVAHGDRAVS